MEIIRIRLLKPGMLAMLLFACSCDPGRSQTPDKSAASPKNIGLAPSTGPTSRPPRVIADLSQFHLDQAPSTKRAGQVGAGSRGGASTALILCAPNRGLTSSTHPLFEWRTPGGAEAQVKFSLLNANGDVLYENDVAGVSMLYPDDAPALVPGETYSWKVSGGAMNNLPEAVKVEVQSKQAHDSLLQRSNAGDAAMDPLALAQAYLKDGLWYDAVATLENARAAHPERKDLTDQLLKLYEHVVPACAAN